MRTDDFQTAREYQLDQYLDSYYDDEGYTCSYCETYLGDTEYCPECDYDEDEHRYKEDEE